jgi:hypothetical protein
MSTPPYTGPALNLAAFNCPRCQAFSNQAWYEVQYHTGRGYRALKSVRFAICRHCAEFSLWVGDRMVDPSGSTAPLPNPDLPKALFADYEEARSVLASSPRSAAALTRLVIQKLCKELGQSGEHLFGDIAALVKGGLSVRVQQALDVVRVIGNNAVHPGQLDVDNAETAIQLFQLVNIIVEQTISQPKDIDALYASLPETQRKAIEQRDKRDVES